MFGTNVNPIKGTFKSLESDAWVGQERCHGNISHQQPASNQTVITHPSSRLSQTVSQHFLRWLLGVWPELSPASDVTADELQEEVAMEKSIRTEDWQDECMKEGGGTDRWMICWEMWAPSVCIYQNRKLTCDRESFHRRPSVGWHVSTSASGILSERLRLRSRPRDALALILLFTYRLTDSSCVAHSDPTIK